MKGEGGSQSTRLFVSLDFAFAKDFVPLNKSSQPFFFVGAFAGVLPGCAGVGAALAVLPVLQ